MRNVPLALGFAAVANPGLAQVASADPAAVKPGVHPLDKSETVGFSGMTTIRRSEFGVKQSVPLVGDDVQLVIAGAFTRQG